MLLQVMVLADLLPAEEPPDTLPRVMRSVVLGAHKLDHDLLLVLDVDEAVAA